MKITMAHGSGGKTSSLLIDNVFKKYFSNEILNPMEDGAVLELTGKAAFSTDSFVVEPLIFPGGNIGKLAVCGTVNDLLCMGAKPRYLSAGFILEEGLSVETLEEVVKSMALAAEDADVKIVTGDTKVVQGSGGLYINTSGIGTIPQGRRVSAANCKPGDAILLSGTLGDHHACILSCRMNIENSIKSDCATLMDITDSLFDAGLGLKAMRDVTRGGLGTILNELAQSSGTEFQLEESLLPVKSDVRSFCDILGLDPVYMGNEGKMAIVVDGQDAEKALAAMKATENGSQAAIIGWVTEGKGVVMKTRLGGTRRVDVLQGEGLPRIC